MKVKFLISSILLVALGVFLASADAHSPAYSEEKEARVDVQEIEQGIQITVTSDDPEIAKDFQKHTSWYKRIFEMANRCPLMGHRKSHSSEDRGCM